jgi:hypothetical protein
MVKSIIDTNLQAVKGDYGTPPKVPDILSRFLSAQGEFEALLFSHPEPRLVGAKDLRKS